MERRPLFGPGGNSDSFRAAGYRSTQDAPAFVAGMGLDAYEYEAGNGLAATPATLRAIGKEAAVHNIRLSYHTPYFISLSGVVEEKHTVATRLFAETSGKAFRLMDRVDEHILQDKILGQHLVCGEYTHKYSPVELTSINAESSIKMAIFVCYNEYIDKGPVNIIP